MINFLYDNGDQAKDMITGFEGVITGRADYITGCNQYLIQPIKEDGEFIESRWMDENRLEIIKKAVIKIVVGVEPGACGSAPIK